MSEPIITMRGIVKKYHIGKPNELEILHGIDMDVREGEFVSIVGASGAGKSTLMKIVAGVYIPDQGNMRLREQEIRLTSPLDALQNGIAMIHQELNLMPFMTVAENIWIRREPKNALGFIDHAELRDRTQALFDELNIDIDPEIAIGDFLHGGGSILRLTPQLAQD